MQRILKTILVVMLGCLAQMAWAETNADMVNQKINALMTKYNIPGAAVVILQAGVPSAYYYGYASREKNFRVTRYTIFEIGSISKIFTSLLLTQELDFAKVSLTDSVQKYLSDLPEKPFKHLSLQSLATHTSGLPFLLPNDIQTQDDVTEYLSEWEPSFAPDSKYIYSNVGIGLLGMALEKETQMDLNVLYRRHILLPLGMQMIGLKVPDNLKKFMATGYDEHDNPSNGVDQGVFQAAYGIKLSGADMQKFLAAAVPLAGTPERVLYPMLMTQMAYVKLDDRQQGLGWEITPISTWTGGTDMTPRNVKELVDRPTYTPKVMLYKTGGTKGFKAYIAVIPFKKAGIAIMVNKSIPNSAIVRTANEILYSVNNIS